MPKYSNYEPLWHAQHCPMAEVGSLLPAELKMPRDYIQLKKEARIEQNRITLPDTIAIEHSRYVFGKQRTINLAR